MHARNRYSEVKHLPLSINIRATILSGQKCRILSMRENKEKIIPFTEAWIGKNDDYEDRAIHDQKKFIGNTILLEDKSTCYWLGDGVYTFKLRAGEHITEYHSIPSPGSISTAGCYSLKISHSRPSHPNIVHRTPFITTASQDVPCGIIYSSDRINHHPSRPPHSR